jgi:transcriptional regulator with XRE-family HTH domain
MSTGVLAYGGMTLGQRLRILAKRERFSQEGLATQIGVSQTLVSAWMNDKYIPDLPQATKLADALGVTVDFLARDDASRDWALSRDEYTLLETFRSFEGELDLRAALKALRAAAGRQEGPRIDVDVRGRMEEPRPSAPGERGRKKGDRHG